MRGEGSQGSGPSTNINGSSACPNTGTVPYGVPTASAASRRVEYGMDGALCQPGRKLVTTPASPSPCFSMMKKQSAKSM